MAFRPPRASFPPFSIWLGEGIAEKSGTLWPYPTHFPHIPSRVKLRTKSRLAALFGTIVSRSCALGLWLPRVDLPRRAADDATTSLRLGPSLRAAIRPAHHG